MEGLSSPVRGTAAVDPVAGRGFLVTQVLTGDGENKKQSLRPLYYIAKKTQEENYESVK